MTSKWYTAYSLRLIWISKSASTVNHCESLKTSEEENRNIYTSIAIIFDIGAGLLFRKRIVAFCDGKLVDARFDGISPNNWCTFSFMKMHRSCHASQTEKSSNPRGIDAFYNTVGKFNIIIEEILDWDSRLVENCFSRKYSQTLSKCESLFWN